MGTGSIGIKLADNKFFPIMDDSAEGSKTLELTTVSENQENVQIRLYRSEASSPNQTIDNAEYIGPLILEGIAKKPVGTPTIKLKITLSGLGDLFAVAQDMDSGMRQTLKVSLKNMSKESLSPAPDFDITGIGSVGLTFSGLDKESFDAEHGFSGNAKMEDEAFAGAPVEPIPSANAVFSDSSLNLGSSEPKDYSASEPGQADEKKRVFIPVWLCALILVVGISLLAAALIFAWRLFFDNREADSALTSTEFASAQANAPPLVAPQRIPEPVTAPDPSFEFASDQANAPPLVAPQRIPEPVTAPDPSFEFASAQANAPPIVAPQRIPEPVTAPDPSSYARESNVIAAQPAPAIPEEPTPPPVWQDDAAAVEVASPEPPKPPEPAPAPQNVRYLVRWGDTLWNIAETFYRNPWRYSYIARYNGIRNPNLIVAGTYLIIPAE